LFFQTFLFIVLLSTDGELAGCSAGSD